MLRHLKNFNELVLYASISCGLAFFVRLNPSFYLAVLLLRIAAIAYSMYIISYVEDNRVFGWCLAAAVVIGMVGGNLDWIQLQLQFNATKFISWFVLLVSMPLMATGIYAHYNAHKGAFKDGQG